MIPPTSIDGTDITGATIDGTDVTEITVDGQTVFSAGPPDSALLRYNFEDDSDTATAIDSIDGYDATINGASYTTTAQVDSLAMSFDGADDYLTYPSSLSEINADGSDSFSIAFWFRPASTGRATVFNYLDGYHWYIEYDENGSQTLVLKNFDGSSVNRFRTSSSISTGSWTHCVITVAADGSTEWYLDNSSDVTGSIAMSPATQSNEHAIGAKSDSNQRYVDGIIDDWQIHDDVLSASDVDTIYNLA